MRSCLTAAPLLAIVREKKPEIAWKDEVFVSWSADDGYIVEDINT